MFERYTERARRVLLLARYEVVQEGGRALEPEHLVLGVLRENPRWLLKFARSGETADTIRARLEAAIVPAGRVSTSAEIPFSPSCKDALAHTPFEADDLKNKAIRPEHIILGVMVKTDGAAARGLRDAGIDPHAIRDSLRSSPEPRDESRDVVGGMVAFAHPPGAVARQWKGVVRPGKAEAYLAHLRQETIFALTQMDGFMTVTIMRREVDDGTEFQVTTFWRSVDAIEAFAGADVTRAVVPAAAQALMVRYDDRAVHYDIVQ